MDYTVRAEDFETLRLMEESLWVADTRFDQNYMDEVLAPDFFEIGRSGQVYQREDIVKSPKRPIYAAIPLPDFSVRMLSEDLAQVTYNSHTTFDSMIELGRRTSIWSRWKNGWTLRFHQGTPYQEDG
jgi:hypothetical protein